MKESFSFTMKKLWGNKGSVLLLIGVYFIWYFFDLLVIERILSRAPSLLMEVFDSLDVLISILVVTYGIFWYNNEKVGIGEVVKRTKQKHYLHGIGVSLFNALVMTLLFRLVLLPSIYESSPIIIILSGVLIYYMLKTSFAIVLVVDQEMNTIEAIKKSFEITRNYKRKIVSIVVLAFLIAIVIELAIDFPLALMTTKENYMVIEKLEGLVTKGTDYLAYIMVNISLVYLYFQWKDNKEFRNVEV